MVSFWRNFTRPRQQSYKLAKLVDSRQLEPCNKAGVHIVCDIDKTYLETEFESVIRMARIAFEDATDKVTVSGASEVLQLARWGQLDVPLPATSEFPRCLHFVSSSPPQLRSVLAEKMMLDGLDWSSDTFKDQAYNLRMGRMDLLRQHVAYKSLAILNLLAAAGPNARFVLIGDNAEQDAYIYSGIKLLADGLLSPTGYRLYLEHAGVEHDVAADLADGLPLRNGAKVVAVLIRNVPGYTLPESDPLSGIVQQFDNFYQAALLLMQIGVLQVENLWQLTRHFHNLHGMTQSQIIVMLTALVERVGAESELGIAATAALGRLHADEAVGPALAETFARSLKCDFERVAMQTEAAIIQGAKKWQKALTAER